MIGKPVETISAAFDEYRGQYEGDSVLGLLQHHDPGFNGTFLGLIDKDCYAEELNFIFGQAVLKGKDAFVALVRLRPSFYGHPENEDVFRGRVLKEVMHELDTFYEGKVGGTHSPQTPFEIYYINNNQEWVPPSTTYLKKLHLLSTKWGPPHIRC